MAPAWLWIVLAAVGLQRLLELAYARVQARRLTAAGAQWVPEDGYGFLVAVHILLFAGVVTEGLLAPWAAEGWWTFAGAFLYAAGAALRYTAMAALGRRWSTRVYTLPGDPLVATGPYRWMRHPVYAGVALELIGIPLLAGLWATLAAVTFLHAFALRRRIRIEEQALGLA
ncbi:MAG: isoprenylcysteine carboxyl methyltransferase family protein [Thermoplasmatota archaeon]|nr:hypothetical protein [Halobacteriales archaeon]